jgi:pantothenate kinase
VSLTLEACSSPWVPLTLTVNSGTPGVTNPTAGAYTVTVTAGAALTVRVGFSGSPTSGTSTTFRVSANLNSTHASSVHGHAHDD